MSGEWRYNSTYSKPETRLRTC